MKQFILISSITSMLLGSSVYAATNSCENDYDTDAKNAVHCNYTSGLNDQKQGKFVKMKITGQYSAPITFIVCAGDDEYNMIEQNDPLIKPNQQITWSFSQCVDEDCGVSKVIAIDKFIIKQKDDRFITEPRVVETRIDPNYGVTCDSGVIPPQLKKTFR